MLERAVIVCVLVACLRCLANAQVVDPPPVIDEFDITKYLGRWYQVSTTPTPSRRYLPYGVVSL